jgi:hypothetical protein
MQSMRQRIGHAGTETARRIGAAVRDMIRTISIPTMLGWPGWNAWGNSRTKAC